MPEKYSTVATSVQKHQDADQFRTDWSFLSQRAASAKHFFLTTACCQQLHVCTVNIMSSQFRFRLGQSFVTYRNRLRHWSSLCRTRRPAGRGQLPTTGSCRCPTSTNSSRRRFACSCCRRLPSSTALLMKSYSATSFDCTQDCKTAIRRRLYVKFKMSFFTVAKWQRAAQITRKHYKPSF